MGQALYRKYRSTSLSEIIGQEHITTALTQAIKTDRISHAYLFTGPRGTGKTSIARILAHAINDLPYSTEPHLDIIEIDAASNRRIDEIRDLRDKVYIAPTSARYKVYIIDEVHMLTREAFNALLKTLEEPPKHVVFMLATTDAHKLPETIVSRTQRYNFKPVEFEKVAAHLAHIAKQENIKAETAALQLLAKHGEGSFRDSISMLDQVSNNADTITLQSVRTQLGIPPIEATAELLSVTVSGTLADLVASLERLYSTGYRAPAIAQQLAEQVRQQLITNQSLLSAARALTLLKELINVAGSSSPEQHLEIILMQTMTPASVAAAAAPATKPAPRPASAVKKPVKKMQPAAEPTPKATPEQPTEHNDVDTAEPTPPTSEAVLSDESWAAVLSELKKQYNTIYGIVRMAHTDFSQPGIITLSFTFAFHQKRINDTKNKKIVTDTIAQVYGQQLQLVCVLAAAPRARSAAVATPTPSAATDDNLQDITSVFGGGELL